MDDPGTSGSSSVSENSEAGVNVNEQSLRQWVVAFCVIRFDHEQGQLIEECYPPGSLTHNEELQVAFHSFPDSVSQLHNQPNHQDSIFFFRFPRRRNSRVANLVSSQTVDVDSTQSPTHGNNGQTSPNPTYLYGFVYSRQRHDQRLSRGAEQKSVVILSHNPFSSVFRPLLQIMGPLYFDIGREALRNVAADVSMWPTPVPGLLMDLRIGNDKTLKVNLPPAHCLPLDCEVIFEELATSIAPCLPFSKSVPQGLFHDSDLYGTFRGLIKQLWMLWELLLIGEPILIIAPTPPQCCEAVAGLVSLVAPLPCNVDFRPYFTIHDPEFTHLASLGEGAALPPKILGVTNLSILKFFKNFRHFVSVGSPEGLDLQKDSSRFVPSKFLNAMKFRRDGPLSLMTEHKEAIWTTYAPITMPDTSILSRLIGAGLSLMVDESVFVVNNDILRRHFLELTTNFLAPFGPYFRPEIPSKKSSHYVTPPPLPTFKDEDFLASLSARTPGKFLLRRMKSNWLDLYRKFLKGHNFFPWFKRKRAVAVKEQYRLWGQDIMRTDIHQFISGMSEVDIVDTCNTIEGVLGEMQKFGNIIAAYEDVNRKLRGDLQAVRKAIQQGSQQIMDDPEKSAHLQLTQDVESDYGSALSPQGSFRVPSIGPQESREGAGLPDSAQQDGEFPPTTPDDTRDG